MAVEKKPRGRPKGAKNKTTIEREAKARAEQKIIQELERLRAEKTGDDKVVEKTAGIKLMKEIAFDFARLFAGRAAFYQPYPTWHQEADPKTGNMRTVNDNPNYNEALFEKYAVLAKDTALGAAGYESPKLSAVMVGAAVVNKVEITGGMPDEFEPPIPGRVEFEPGTIISAEDETPDQKIVNGEIVQLPVKTGAA